jgi:hypothetical protein
VNRRQAEKNVKAYGDAQQAYQQEQAAPAPSMTVAQSPSAVVSPAPAPTQDDTLEQLERLGALHAQGILTDEEFAAQKAKILGI